jgi:protein TonB
MNSQPRPVAAGLSFIGLLAALTGCANAPSRPSTLDLTGQFPAVSSRAASVQPPVPLQTVVPRYPDSMKHSRIRGIVHVLCLIDENGHVKEANIRSFSDREFIEPALEALWKWTFAPAQRDGVALPMRVSVPVRFSVADE